MPLTRRDALLVGSGMAVGALGWHWLAKGHGVAVPPPERDPVRRYGHGVEPPPTLGPLSRERVTRPPSRRPDRDPADLALTLDVVDQAVPVANGRVLRAWTFGGDMPGPILRATEGDRLAITLRNRSAEPHNLHFHGRHELAADGWEPIPPGGEHVYRLTAGPAGLHPYHCDLTPAADHVGNGLYGVLIVDPVEPREPAHEIVLVLGGFDTDGDGRSDLFGWNGVAGFYAKYPIKVPAGELIRIYLVNLVMDEPLASIHLHAQTFEVYRSGTGRQADETTDIVSLGPAERAMLELRLPERGRYMFHPHQRHLAEGGAMGWIAAV